MTDPSDAQDPILAALEPLREKQRALMVEEGEIREALGRVRDQVHRIERVLRTAEPQPKKKIYTKSASQLAEATVRERADRMVALMRKAPERDWVLRDLERELGVPKSGLRDSLNYLREQSIVRPTRGIQGGGHAYGLYPQA